MATEMVAGRELDAQIARRVFGLCAVVTPGKPWWPNGSLDGHVRTQPDGTGGRTYLPHYSTKIEDAWAIVEHLMGRGCYCTLTTGTRTNGGRFFFVRIGTPGDAYVWHGDAETAPLAICRCALVIVAELAAATGEGA